MSLLKILLMIGLTIAVLGCQKEEEKNNKKYLYVASGACYSGTGNTTYTATTASNVIFRLNLETGQYEGRIADFTTVEDSAGTTPVAVRDYDDEHLMVLIQHTTLRRIELIKKQLAGERRSYYTNTSAAAPYGALQTNVSDMVIVDDGLLIARTNAIEKLDTGKIRKAGNGTNAWVQGPGGDCSTSTVNMTSVTTIPTTANTVGYNILYTHSQNASSATNNRAGIIDGDTGWNGTLGCLDDQSTVAATAYPTAAVYMSNYNRVVIAYAGTNVTEQNSLYTYAVDTAATSNILSDAVNSFEDPSTLYGISAMTYDESTGHLYVASGGSVATNLTTGSIPYKIEKFSFDPTTKKFTRVSTSAFYSGNIESRCISSMAIGN